ncbi:MAG TPA: tetratricopeptide repeat protein [Bacteroidales bacterium]
MNKKFSLSIILTSMLLLTSCAGKFAPTSDFFTVTPQVLVAQGGKVPATVDGTFPAKAFPTKGIVTITPVLKYEGGEALGTPITLQGEKVKGNNKVISKAGGSFSVSSVFDYIPAMSKSELVLRFTTTIGKKVISIPEIKVADGVIATETLADATTATPSLSEDKFQRIIKEAHEASIMFLIQQAALRKTELTSNPVAALSEQFAATAKDANKQIAGIEVSSYASPDGSMSLNENLASNREKNTVGYLEKELKKAKATGTIDAKFTAEDWDGFKELVTSSNIQDKELILRVLSMYSDPEKREQEIKNLSAVYQNLAEEILPKLRRSKMVLTVDIIGKTDEQIKDLAVNDPSKLNVEELLYSATLFNTASEKESIYTKATELYPNDYRAYNNLGGIALQAGNLDKAKSNLDKAYSLSKTADVSSNLALYSMASGAPASTVDSYLGASAGATGLNEALGIQYIKKGQYAKAVDAFGSIKSNNAGLAQLLAKDYSKAKSTLDAVPAPNAQTSYLKAIIGARTNNKDLVISGLKSAISLDKSYAKKATKDLEFSKYITDPTVAGLLN